MHHPPKPVEQTPAPGTSLLRFTGDCLRMEMRVPRALLAGGGKAFVRTNIGHGANRLREIVEHTEDGRPPLASDWHDIAMTDEGDGLFTVSIPLEEVGHFEAKALYIAGDDISWPDGGNISVKVEPAHTRRANSIYTAFVRQFRDESRPDLRREVEALDAAGYTVIPPSGTFRALASRLDHIIGTMGFRIIQLLPIHPVPTTYARMGRYGSPFASLDFMSVDPAYAEFDGHTTPLDQFRELADAIHARGGLLFIDLPANHTGWASTFQTAHPEWFRREADGRFTSPGAWGVVWEDLVALDHSLPAVREAMAEVFLFWCENGVDGFRCDAGYMIPAETWTYIVARVRRHFPDVVFMLEGLGGSIEATDTLLTASNLDWAYSEIFQCPDRDAISSYLAKALPRSESIGPLVNFAETHDNDRLAARGKPYARLRTALAALLSQQGAFGITAGVEWFCRDKIDVHGAPPLNWGAEENQVDFIARLNRILASHPSFDGVVPVRLVQRGPGNVIAALRDSDAPMLVCANLDLETPATVGFDASAFPFASATDLLTDKSVAIGDEGTLRTVSLPPAGIAALVPHSA